MDGLLHSGALLVSARAALEVLFAAALKLAILLGAAGLASLMLHRASAAARHLIWSTAICGGLLLPVLALLLPAWRVSSFQTPLSLRAVAGVDAPAIADTAVSDTSTKSFESSGSLKSSSNPSSGAWTNVEPVAASRTDRLLMEARRMWPVWALALWLGGAAVVLGQLVLGRWRVRRLADQAEALEEAGWSELRTSLSQQMGLRQSVELLQAPDASVPMTWGSLHPRVLLPQEARRWPLPRRRVVLLHELAHIQRLDCLTQSLAQVCCALYWFHPLVWVAARALRSEREKACDDLVLSSGAEKASDYAGHLLDIARSMHSSVCCSGFATVAMARRSQLEGRLLAILDPSLSRRALRPGLVAAAVLFSATFLLPLSAIQPMAQAIEPSTPGTTIDGAKASVEIQTTKTEKKWNKHKHEENYDSSKDDSSAPAGSSKAMDVLLSIVQNDPDTNVQREAVEALRHMDGSYQHIVQIARTHSNEEVRRQAIDALSHDDNEQRALETLILFAEKDGNVEVQRQAVDSMSRLSGSFEPLVQIARTHPNTEVRREAIDALRKSDDSARALEVILGIVDNDPDVEVQRSAVEALRHMDGAFDHLVRIARSHGNPEVRREAVAALRDF